MEAEAVGSTAAKAADVLGPTSVFATAAASGALAEGRGSPSEQLGNVRCRPNCLKVSQQAAFL